WRRWATKLCPRLAESAPAQLPIVLVPTDDIRARKRRTDDFLKRSDLAAIYQESARWFTGSQGIGVKNKKKSQALAARLIVLVEITDLLHAKVYKCNRS